MTEISVCSPDFLVFLLDGKYTLKNLSVCQSVNQKLRSVLHDKNCKPPYDFFPLLILGLRSASC